MEPVPPPFRPETLNKTRPHLLTPADGDLLGGAEPKLAESKRILLVDDDHQIRGLMRAFLQAEGYEVFSCSNGPRALKVFTLLGDVDLLLTDLQMPGMDGFELAEHVTAARTDLPVVIVSGSVMTEELLGRIRANG